VVPDIKNGVVERWHRMQTAARRRSVDIRPLPRRGVLTDPGRTAGSCNSTRQPTSTSGEAV